MKMGCWLKQYKRGVAWWCNTTNKKISPVMDYRLALMANIYGTHSYYSMSDARTVADWKQAQREAKRQMKGKDEVDIDNIIEEFYGSKIEKLEPW